MATGQDGREIPRLRRPILRLRSGQAIRCANAGKNRPASLGMTGRVAMLGIRGVKRGAAQPAWIGNGSDGRTELAGGEGVEGAEAVS
jgi:hypothetical protein